MSFVEHLTYSVACDDCHTELTDPDGKPIQVQHFTLAADIATHSGWCPMGFGIHLCPSCAHIHDSYGDLDTVDRLGLAS